MTLDLFSPGIYLRCPGGNNERPDWHKKAASWGALNLGSDACVNRDPSVWDFQRRNVYGQAFFPYFPWLHCRTVADIRWLISVGKQWVAEGGQNVLGVNIEDVVGDGLDLEEVASVLTSEWGGQVHLPTLPWVQNGQGWYRLAFAVAALEIFPDENEESKHVEDCIDHAFKEGLTKVTLMFKTANHQPSDYDMNACHSLYTADDVTPTAEAWTMWAGAAPCVKPTPVTDPWYSKPYPKGPAIGPATLPRTFVPPSHGKGIFTGPGVMAAKRAISRAQRWEPWAPEKWDSTYGDPFALGRGTGRVGDSGVRGFQRQEGITEDGVLGDETYQRMRRSKIPAGNPNAGEYIFDSVCRDLLQKEVKQFGPEAIAEAKFQKLLAAMKMLSDNTPGYLLGGGHGIPLSEVSPYQRLDCSSSTSKVLYEAEMYGLGQYAIVSGDFGDWGLPGVGKYFTVYYNSTHVWTRLHKSQWWRFDTSPHGDGGRGPKLRYLPRFTGGFAARHWEGM